MGREFSRLDRIGEQIQKDLALIIQRELKDPRLGMVTINAAKISKDLGYADIYFTALNVNDVDDREVCFEAKEILQDAAGYLRAELGRAIKLRTMPQLRFHYDKSIGQAQHINSLLGKARAKDAGDAEPSDSDS